MQLKKQFDIAFESFDNFLNFMSNIEHTLQEQHVKGYHKLFKIYQDEYKKLWDMGIEEIAKDKIVLQNGCYELTHDIINIPKGSIQCGDRSSMVSDNLLS